MQRYLHFYTLTLGAYNSQRGNNEVPKFSKYINNFDNLSNHTRIKLVRRGSAFYLIKNLARNLYHVKFDTLCKRDLEISIFYNRAIIYYEFGPQISQLHLIGKFQNSVWGTTLTQ